MLLIFVVVAYLSVSWVTADAQTAFYQGKTLTLIHGRSVGGSGGNEEPRRKQQGI